VGVRVWEKSGFPGAIACQRAIVTRYKRLPTLKISDCSHLSRPDGFQLDRRLLFEKDQMALLSQDCIAPVFSKQLLSEVPHGAHASSARFGCSLGYGLILGSKGIESRESAVDGDEDLGRVALSSELDVLYAFRANHGRVDCEALVALIVLSWPDTYGATSPHAPYPWLPWAL